jgi:hypothetical protein
MAELILKKVQVSAKPEQISTPHGFSVQLISSYSILLGRSKRMKINVCLLLSPIVYVRPSSRIDCITWARLLVFIFVGMLITFGDSPRLSI